MTGQGSAGNVIAALCNVLFQGYRPTSAGTSADGAGTFSPRRPVMAYHAGLDHPSVVHSRCHALWKPKSDNFSMA